ncbi:MAG: hypothetical protein ABR551_13185 [Gemmatimonadales bacterium]
MPALAALLDTRPALATLRRGLARGRCGVLTCRNVNGLLRTLAERAVDGVILGPQVAQRGALPRVRGDFPGIPLIVFGALRADDATQIAGWHAAGVREVVVEGVDDAVVGDLVSRHSCTARRREALREAPTLLRLTEPIQLDTWALLMEEPGAPWEATQLAERLAVSREHLSRQFGAGGAPNLKRVIDFLRVVSVAELGGNPGLDPSRLARLTGFSSPAHLRATVRRITGETLEGIAGAPPQTVLGRFVRVGRRSRG